MKKKVHPYCKKRMAWRLANPMTAHDLSNLLTMVSYDVPEAVLEGRTALERAEAEEWACQVHLSASDNLFVRIPKRPWWIEQYEYTATDMMHDLKEMKRSDFLGHER